MVILLVLKLGLFCEKEVFRVLHWRLCEYRGEVFYWPDDAGRSLSFLIVIFDGPFSIELGGGVWHRQIAL